MILGQSTYEQSKEFIEDHGDKYDLNEKFTDATFTYFKWAYILLTLGRLPLILIACYKIKLCKFFIYYQMLFSLVEVCLPRDEGTVYQQLLMWVGVINFYLHYFDFWPGVFSILFVQVF